MQKVDTWLEAISAVRDTCINTNGYTADWVASVVRANGELVTLICVSVGARCNVREWWFNPQSCKFSILSNEKPGIEKKLEAVYLERSQQAMDVCWSDVLGVLTTEMTCEYIDLSATNDMSASLQTILDHVFRSKRAG